MMKEDYFQKELLRRLDVLISLQLESPVADKQPSIASKVHRLINLGLTPREVAAIIGKPINYVTAVLATKRARLRKVKAHAGD